MGTQSTFQPRLFPQHSVSAASVCTTCYLASEKVVGVYWKYEWPKMVAPPALTNSPLERTVRPWGEREGRERARREVSPMSTPIASQHI